MSKLCPCSDHPFKLISSTPLIKHISEVYDQLLCNKLDIYALTTASLQNIRDGYEVEPGYITRDDVMTYHRGIPKHTITSGDPLYILMEPCDQVKKLRDVYYPSCMAKHYTPRVCTRALIEDFRHIPLVWETYTEAMMQQYYTANWPDTMAASMHACALEELQKHPIYDYLCQNMDDCDIKTIIHACSRAVQDLLMRMHLMKGENQCIWACVPKDVIKMIHRRVFAGYIVP